MGFFFSIAFLHHSISHSKTGMANEEKQEKGKTTWGRDSL
jgi:hypothetical protein